MATKKHKAPGRGTLLKNIFLCLFVAIFLIVNCSVVKESTSTIPIKTEEKKEKKEKKQETPVVKKPPARADKKDKKIQTDLFKKTIISKPAKKYKGEPGDFIFYKADLENVLLFFAKQYKLNIVIDPGIKGEVTCRMIQVPWDQALDVILRQQGLAMMQDGRIVRATELK